MLLFIARVSGHSMEPTLFQKDQLLVSSIPYLFTKPKVGDIVVFTQNKEMFIKRIKYIKKGMVFVVGDNAHDSKDSRKFGWIQRKNILGKVIRKL